MFTTAHVTRDLKSPATGIALNSVTHSCSLP